MPDVNEHVIQNLKFLCRTADGLTKFITATKLRLHAIDNPANLDTILNGYAGKQNELITCPVCKEEVKVQISKQYQGITHIKGRLLREIGKELEFFPIWTEWAKRIPGIGPVFAGNLILFYYYRFTPICQECGGNLIKTPTDNDDRQTFVCESCGKKAKGEGVLAHKIELKDFAKISSWWHYLGMHVVDGKKPKRQKGVLCDWNSKGRTIAHQIGAQFNRCPPDNLYKAFLEKERVKIQRKNPDLTKGHNLNRAQSHTAKLFLSHWWQVCRTLDKLPVTRPYAETIMGHTGILEPFYL